MEENSVEAKSKSMTTYQFYFLKMGIHETKNKGTEGRCAITVVTACRQPNKMTTRGR